jgi:hypothetical protein
MIAMTLAVILAGAGVFFAAWFGWVVGCYPKPREAPTAELEKGVIALILAPTFVVVALIVARWG